MKWICKVCGYEAEGDAPPAECPICGVDASEFEKAEEKASIAVTTEDFSRNATRKMSYGIYVVTAGDGGRVNGQTANSVTQITSRPRQVVMGLNKENLTTEMVLASGFLGVNILGQDAYNTAAAFGFASGRTKDKLASYKYTLENGAPLLTTDALAGYTCKVISSTDAGTHILFLCEVLEGGFDNPDKQSILPMTYRDFRILKEGGSLEQAVQTEKPASDAPAEQGKYICDVCGWVYDPKQEGKPFSEQPADYICPICGAGKDQFRPL